MRLLLLLLLCTAFPTLGFAQQAATQVDPAPAPAAVAPATEPAAPSPQPEPKAGKLTVIAKPAPPFVIAEEGAAPRGFSVDLWARVAQELKLSYEVKTVDTVPKLLETLQAKRADVGIGALTVTSQREAIIDFLYPFYDSGLQIMVPQQQRTSMFSAFKSVMPDLIKVLGILLLALLVNAHLLWFFERRANSESFPDRYPFGVWQAAWWSICTLITGGCENIAPAAVRGRLLAIIWMLTGFGLVSFVTARMASIMTVNTLTSEVRALGDLRGAQVGTIAGSASQAYLTKEPVTVKGYPDLAAAVKAMKAGEIKAVIYDAPLLRYYLAQNAEEPLQLVGSQFEKQRYAFALQPGSSYRKEINRVLLTLGETGYFDELDRKWFGAEKKAEGAAEK